jgi:hypothetical protein
MIKCPICQTEYSEEQVESCSTCHWNFNVFSQVSFRENIFRGQLLGISQQIEEWGRKLWEQHYLKLEAGQQESSEEKFEEMEKDRSHIQIHTNVLLNQISRLISPLEKRLDNIEQYLSAKTSDNDLDCDAVSSDRNLPPVPQEIQTPKPESSSEAIEIHLSLLEAQLVAQYNKKSNSLLNQAMQVSQTEDSLTQTNKSAFFETTRRGNYLIITIENLTYLVPKPNIKFNQYNYQTLKNIFQCYGYETVNNSEFLLLKPAVVTSLAIGQKWHLAKPGILQFISKEDNDISIDEETLLDSEEPLVTQIEEIADPRNYVTIPLKTEIKSTPIHPEEPTPKIEDWQPPTDLYLSPQEVELVLDYNKNPNFLSKIATEVLETEDSIIQRRKGNSESLVFENNRWGNYWIINKGGLNYLLPRGNLKITKNNYEKLEGLFECYGYQPELSIKFQLIKPSRISLISENKWQILELGIVQFCSI